MKRRDFLKVLGITATAPVVAKAAELTPKTDVLTTGVDVRKGPDLPYSGMTDWHQMYFSSNRILTPEEITRTSAELLNRHLSGK